MQKALNLALCGMFHQANPEVSAQAQPNPAAISPETLAAMPSDVKNGPVAAGRNWTQAGMEFGKTFLAAEQGIVTAEATLTETRIKGLLELAELQSDANGTERAQFIGGVDSAFRAKDGDKLTKSHQNYMADLRRVSGALKAGTPLGELIESLKKPGTYPERVARIPRQSNAGGQNKGTGTKAATATAAQAIQQHGGAAVTEALQNLGKPQQPSGPLSQAPEQPAAPKISQQAEISTDQMVKDMDSLHEDQIERIGLAYANRCMRSASPLFQEIGAWLSKRISEELISDSKPPVAKAA